MKEETDGSNSKTMTTTEKKQRLNQLLESFDWFYQRTEDPRVYQKWSRVKDEIRSLRYELGEDGEYLYSKHHRRRFPELY